MHRFYRRHKKILCLECFAKKLCSKFFRDNKYNKDAKENKIKEDKRSHLVKTPKRLFFKKIHLIPDIQIAAIVPRIIQGKIQPELLIFPFFSRFAC